MTNQQENAGFLVLLCGGLAARVHGPLQTWMSKYGNTKRETFITCQIDTDPNAMLVRDLPDQQRLCMPVNRKVIHAVL
ncbi:MAG: hypothetical protein NTW87_11910, partial [Planctomycetota bacterium]|nr:hypothetical protein [Planctomycetota bacterium]